MGEEDQGSGRIEMQLLLSLLSFRFLVVAMLLLSAPIQALAEEGGTNSVRKIVRFGLTVHNPMNRAVQGESLLVYAPADTSNQRVVRLEASHPYQLVADARGNQLMDFSIASLAPHATMRVSVTATVDLANVPKPALLDGDGSYLRPEAFIEADDPGVREMAKRLNDAGVPERFVDRVYEWVRHRIRYAGFVAEDLGALSAFRTGRGDCSEYAYLVAALSRAAGVPARVMGGFVVPSNAVLKANEYHNWAEVYVDGRWQLVDAQKGVLREHSADYVSTRVVSRQGEDETRRFFHRYLSPGGVLKVEMD